MQDFAERNFAFVISNAIIKFEIREWVKEGNGFTNTTCYIRKYVIRIMSLLVVLLALTPQFLSYLLFQLRSRSTKKTNRLVMNTSMW